MKNRIETFIEYEFNTKDLDSQTIVIDTILVNANIIDEEKINKVIEDYVNKSHPVTTLHIKHCWVIEGWETTGKRIEKQTTYTMISQRKEEFDKPYPISEEL